MVIITVIKIMTMTSERRNGTEYTTISILVETREELASLMPKSWDWDRCLKVLTEMWREQKGKATKLGKPAQDNQTS